MRPFHHYLPVAALIYVGVIPVVSCGSLESGAHEEQDSDASSFLDPVCAASRYLYSKCVANVPIIDGTILFQLAMPAGYSGAMSNIPDDVICEKLGKLLPSLDPAAGVALMSQIRSRYENEANGVEYDIICDCVPESSSNSRVRWFSKDLRVSILPVGVTENTLSAIVIFSSSLWHPQSGVTFDFISLSRGDCNSQWSVTGHYQYKTFV